MNLRRLFLLPVVLAALSSATIAQETGKPAEVIFLSTNDMHAKIDNMAKLAFLADSLKKTHPDVFLVSAGDNFTGNPVVDMAPDKGSPMIDLMNHCGFTVSAVGNHEFDMGQDMLQKKLREAHFPFICANLDATVSGLGPIRPYTVIGTKSGDSIAILGLIQLNDNGIPSALPSHLNGIRFVTGISGAKKYTWLKSHYGNLVGLTHLGVEYDKRLADSLPQFDLIIGGHSHTVIDTAKMENGVMIVQAGYGLKYVGKTTLLIEHGHITGRRYELIPFTALKREDTAVRALIDRYNNNPELDRVLAVAENPIEGPDEMGSMTTDALTSLLKVDFAFQNRGGIRIHSLPKGNITYRDVYKLDPFNNQVLIYTMKAGEIESLICYGFQLEHDIDLRPSGLTYRITDDGTKHCARVELFDTAGRPLDREKEYSVALNGYIASAYQFNHKDPGTETTYTTTDAIIRYLLHKKSIDYKGVKRVSLKQ